MIQLKDPLILVLLLCFSLFSFGQEKKSEQEFNKYCGQLISSKIDSILVIRSGCTGCDITYTDTSKSVSNGQTIYVLTQKSGKFNLAIFDDIHNPKFFTADTCSLFDTINQNKSLLQSKEAFYRKELAELKKSKFLPPGPVHYSFEELTIQLPKFRYNFLITNKDYDYLGFDRKNEKWFQETKTIIAMFHSYLKAIKS